MKSGRGGHSNSNAALDFRMQLDRLDLTSHTGYFADVKQQQQQLQQVNAAPALSHALLRSVSVGAGMPVLRSMPPLPFLAPHLQQQPQQQSAPLVSRVARLPGTQFVV